MTGSGNCSESRVSRRDSSCSACTSPNWRTTGDALENGYQASGDLSQSVGFRGVHSVAAGLDNTFYNVATLTTASNGWPGYVRLAFVLVPFVLATRQNSTGSSSPLLAIISSAAFFTTTGAVKGPRVCLRSAPFLLLLAARGFDALAALGERALHHPHQEPVTRHPERHRVRHGMR